MSNFLTILQQVDIEKKLEEAPDVGYRTICYALQYFSMIDPVFPKAPQPTHFVKMKDVFFKEKEGEFAKPWKHYDSIMAGEVIGVYTDGDTVTAPYDGVLILPKSFSEVGKEWFYFGVKTDCPAPMQ